MISLYSLSRSRKRSLNSKDKENQWCFEIIIQDHVSEKNYFFILFKMKTTRLKPRDSLFICKSWVLQNFWYFSIFFIFQCLHHTYSVSRFIDLFIRSWIIFGSMKKEMKILFRPAWKKNLIFSIQELIFIVFLQKLVQKVAITS